MRSFVALAALASAVLAAPHESRQVGYYVINDGKHGSQTGEIDEFSSRSHSSTFFTHLGCSTTAKIERCFTAILPADPKASLETFDFPGYVVGGVGTNQRAYLLPEIYHGASGIVTHKVRLHISTTYSDVPKGPENAVTFVSLRNANETRGLKTFDLKARQFIGEETSGTVFYFGIAGEDGREDFPTQYDFAAVVGRTIEVEYRLGVNGVTTDKDGFYVAEATVRSVTDKNKLLWSVAVSKDRFPKGIVDTAAHRLLFGADRKATVGQQELKVWFGDYTVTPDQPSQPE